MNVKAVRSKDAKTRTGGSPPLRMPRGARGAFPRTPCTGSLMFPGRPLLGNRVNKVQPLFLVTIPAVPKNENEAIVVLSGWAYARRCPEQH